MDVTIVIPCFNTEPAHLKLAVESACAQSSEVIVVDDGSDRDDTVQALDALSVRVIRTDNGGPARARNIGIAAGLGAYVLCLDSDDHLGEGLVEALAEHLRLTSDTVIAYSVWERFGADAALVEPPGEVNGTEMVQHCPIISAGMFRRNDWERLGGYDESLRVGFEDWEWWCRLLLATGGLGRLVEGARYYYRTAEESRQIAQSRGVTALQATRRAMMDNNPAHTSLIAEAVISADLPNAYLWGTLQSPIAEAASRQARYWAARYGRLEGLLAMIPAAARIWDRVIAK